ncbi:Helix-turn-helix domain-containing protein [Streptomyces sp. TLI_053]|uniref:helix-turn-helix domain-containing protein n=1 Tax=Streptomyces sp. TLI_053 TaxID=1855352 RepID=UPI0008796EE8|nr:helix-turn-helix transcriptional regulator [Streptomyces sp. TLI_053]SDT67355.1 Helix-turn-helix domain-containing protein [Streptomyces sp. TLI_053]
MGFRTDISERQRRFGDELRRLRNAAGLSAAEIGEALGMKGPAVSHTEAGRLGLNLERLALWLDTCGVNDAEYREGLIAMCQSNGKGWWTEYRPHVVPEALDLAEFEASATAFINYQTHLIPGFLQTKAYIEVIHEYAEKKVEFRLRRQQMITAENAQPFHAVIHEAALHMMYGGPAVMREQLNHLIEMAHLPHVTIQILPFDSTVYASTDTAFLLMHGAHARLDTILLENPHGPTFVGDPEGVAAFRRKFDRLKGMALPPLNASVSGPSPAFRDSWGMIQHVRYKLLGR